MIPGIMAAGMRVATEPAGDVQNLRYVTEENPPSVYFANDRRTFLSGPGAPPGWWKAWSNVYRRPNDGPFYFEMLLEKHIKVGTNLAIGIADANNGSGGNAGDSGRIQYFDDGRKRQGGFYEPYGAAFEPGDRIGVAINSSGLYFYKNGVSQGRAYGLSGGSSYEPHFCVYANASTDELALNFPAAMLYLPPGHTPWA